MVAVGRMGNRDDRVRRRFICNVGIRGHVVADDADVAVRVVEVDVKLAIGRILRMECDAEEPSLATSGDLAAHIEKRRREHRVPLENPHASRLFHHEQPF